MLHYRRIIGCARKGKATPGMDCALHKGWMSQVELVETEAEHMEGWVSGSGWLFYLLAPPGWLPHSFHACVTTPASSAEATDFN